MWKSAGEVLGKLMQSVSRKPMKLQCSILPSPSFYLQGGFTVTKWLVVIHSSLLTHIRVASEKYLPSLYASKFASITDFHQWYVKGMDACQF